MIAVLGKLIWTLKNAKFTAFQEYVKYCNQNRPSTEFHLNQAIACILAHYFELLNFWIFDIESVTSKTTTYRVLSKSSTFCIMVRHIRFWNHHFEFTNFDSSYRQLGYPRQQLSKDAILHMLPPHFWLFSSIWEKKLILLFQEYSKSDKMPVFWLERSWFS